MEKKLNDLFLLFQKKKFMPIEISGLVKDVFNILDNGKLDTITDINRELEDLGWGIEIMDHITYELAKSLIQQKGYKNELEIFQIGPCSNYVRY